MHQKNQRQTPNIHKTLSYSLWLGYGLLLGHGFWARACSDSDLSEVLQLGQPGSSRPVCLVVEAVP